MENNPNDPSPIQPSPLHLGDKDKLKIYSILSLHNDTPVVDIKDRLGLTLVAAYSLQDAIVSANMALTAQGKDFKKFQTPHIFVYLPVEQFVDIKTATVEIPKETLENLLHENNSPYGHMIDRNLGIQKATEEQRKEKSKQELSAHVRYVFGEVATPEEIIVSENVVGRFLAGVDK